MSNPELRALRFQVPGSTVEANYLSHSVTTCGCSPLCHVALTIQVDSQVSVADAYIPSYNPHAIGSITHLRTYLVTQLLLWL